MREFRACHSLAAHRHLPEVLVGTCGSTTTGHHWLADESVEAGGADAGPSPHRPLLSALRAWTAITVQIHAARKQWPLSGVEVELRFNPAGTPASGHDIARAITLQGRLTDEQRERLLQIADACPIHKVLTGQVRIATTLANQ